MNSKIDFAHWFLNLQIQLNLSNWGEYVIFLQKFHKLSLQLFGVAANYLLLLPTIRCGCQQIVVAANKLLLLPINCCCCQLMVVTANELLLPKIKKFVNNLLAAKTFLGVMGQ